MIENQNENIFEIKTIKVKETSLRMNVYKQYQPIGLDW